MPSPFPGMVPYLEDPNLWPDFHHHLVMCLYQSVLPGLGERYRSRCSQRTYADAETRTEEYVEIRQQSDGRLVTLIDVVSPWNKATESGRRAYLETRQAAKDAGANTVEIDLVLHGRPTLDYPRDNLPVWDYAVTVTRSTQPDRHEIYTATLNRRLPRFRLPLAADDRDTVLDLYTIFSRTFEQGGFASRIDYRRDPATPLTPAQRSRFDEALGRPSAEATSLRAYQIWERAGRPDGCDQEHWYRAIEELIRERT